MVLGQKGYRQMAASRIPSPALPIWFGSEAVGGGYRQYNCAIVRYNNLQCTIAMVWYRGGWL